MYWLLTFGSVKLLIPSENDERKALNPKKYAMIIALRVRKCSLKSIGRKVKCSKNTLAATIKRYEETGSFLPRERNKKKRWLSLKDD